jgi:hypothetical protein
LTAITLAAIRQQSVGPTPRRARPGVVSLSGMNLKRFTKHLGYSNVIASLALFVALGGASYAAVTLPANSVGTKQLAKKAVSGSKIKRNAITSPKVQDGSLLAADFKAGELKAGSQGPIGPAGPKGDPGERGPAGERGPSDAFSVGNGTIAGSDPPLDLPVPAGDYFVTAKVAVGNAPGNTLTRCDLSGGSDSDATFGSLETSGHTQETMISTMVTHFDAAGAIHFSCNLGGANPGQAVLNAVQVGAAH